MTERMYDTVECPDCKRGTIQRGCSCTECGLSWEDLEVAAEFYERLVEEAKKSC